MLRCLSGHVPAAVDADGLASDEIAFSEERGYAAYFVGGAEKADGKAIGRSVRIGGDHVGGDQGRSDGISRDAFLREQRSVRVGETD